MATRDERSMTRAEWIAAAAFALNVLTLAFGGGVVWRDVQDNTRTNAEQERKLDALIPRVERIDTNVEFLAEEARERRKMERRK